LKMSFFKDSAYYDLLRRSNEVNEFQIQVKVRIPHQGSAANTYTVIEMTMDRASFAGAEMP
jgi:hypothetical protein